MEAARWVGSAHQCWLPLTAGSVWGSELHVQQEQV